MKTGNAKYDKIMEMKKEIEEKNMQEIIKRIGGKK